MSIFDFALTCAIVLTSSSVNNAQIMGFPMVQRPFWPQYGLPGIVGAFDARFGQPVWGQRRLTRPKPVLLPPRFKSQPLKEPQKVKANKLTIDDKLSNVLKKMNLDYGVVRIVDHISKTVKVDSHEEIVNIVTFVTPKNKNCRATWLEGEDRRTFSEFVLCNPDSHKRDPKKNVKQTEKNGKGKEDQTKGKPSPKPLKIENTKKNQPKDTPTQNSSKPENASENQPKGKPKPKLPLKPENVKEGPQSKETFALKSPKKDEIKKKKL